MLHRDPVPPFRPDHHETASLDAAFIQELYGSGGLYDLLTNVFEQSATEIGRSHVIYAYNQNIPLAVHAQRMNESGFTSITVGETLDIIADSRWQYRLLLPGFTNMISRFHYSEHQGGQYSNRPPLIEYTNGIIIRQQNNVPDWTIFKDRYLDTVRQAYKDICSITTLNTSENEQP